MTLHYDIIDVSNISASQKEEMFRLMEQHYVNVRFEDFIADLSEKQWAILLYSPCNIKLAGFSTQLSIIPDPDSGFNDCLLLYSGDTIIAHEYWGSVSLPIAFLQLVEQIRDKFPRKKIYWMLISKGLRTYKFLSVFLNEYYPNYKAETPDNIKKIMQYFGHKKFGNRFNQEKGIISAEVNGQYLKEDYQPVENKNNPVAGFFYEKNPGYKKGDELLCLSELSNSNLHPFIKRIAQQYIK